MEVNGALWKCVSMRKSMGRRDNGFSMRLSDLLDTERRRGALPLLRPGRPRPSSGHRARSKTCRPRACPGSDHCSRLDINRPSSKQIASQRNTKTKHCRRESRKRFAKKARGDAGLWCPNGADDAPRPLRPLRTDSGAGPTSQAKSFKCRRAAGPSCAGGPGQAIVAQDVKGPPPTRVPREGRASRRGMARQCAGLLLITNRGALPDCRRFAAKWPQARRQ